MILRSGRVAVKLSRKRNATGHHEVEWQRDRVRWPRWFPPTTISSSSSSSFAPSLLPTRIPGNASAVGVVSRPFGDYGAVRSKHRNDRRTRSLSSLGGGCRGRRPHFTNDPRHCYYPYYDRNAATTASSMLSLPPSFGFSSSSNKPPLLERTNLDQPGSSNTNNKDNNNNVEST